MVNKVSHYSLFFIRLGPICSYMVATFEIKGCESLSLLKKSERMLLKRFHDKDGENKAFENLPDAYKES